VKKQAVEMTVYGRGGKPKAGFPPRPQPLEIAKGAIPTFPPPRLGVEKWKTKSRFPTFPLVVFILKTKPQKGGLAADRFAHAFRLILQLENAVARASLRPSQTDWNLTPRPHGKMNPC
jgi:hypothetical protein